MNIHANHAAKKNSNLASPIHQPQTSQKNQYTRRRDNKFSAHPALSNYPDSPFFLPHVRNLRNPIKRASRVALGFGKSSSVRVAFLAVENVIRSAGASIARDKNARATSSSSPRYCIPDACTRHSRVCI